MNRIAPTALYQEVAERLRQRIFAHELTPGTWIDEQKLAEQYGISRTPLREALKVLASEGLVELRPRRGCYVTEISRQDLDDIFPLIAMLEGRCAADAVNRIGGQIGPQTPGWPLLRITLAQAAPILPYLLLVLILVFRPKGLMGTREN